MHVDELPQAPTWLLDLCEKAGPKQQPQTQPLTELDDEQAIERAKDYLRELDPAVEGERNGHGYRTACRLKDFGLSQPMTESVMLEHWRCQPMLEHAELEHVVNSAYTYGTTAPGAASPQADFEPIDDAAAAAEIFSTKAPRPALYYLRPSEIKPNLDRISLIEDYLDQGAMSVMYGESNTGKTFLAMDLAFHVATGRAWHDRRTVQGTALYVAAEGGLSAKNRVEALKKRYELDDFPLALVPCSVDLLRRNADTQPLIELAEDAAKTFGQQIGLVVIDTLSRAIAGGNENSPDDMGALVRNLDRLRAATKAHVLIVHHSGKDRAKGARGHSLLRAATDTEIEVERGTAKVTKQRDMEFSRPVGFSLEPVALGTNAYGKAVSSCIVLTHAASAGSDFEKVKLTTKEKQAMETLVEAISKHGVEPDEVGDVGVWGRAVNVGVWREMHGAFLPVPPESRRKAWKRLRDNLRDKKLIEIHEEYVWLR